MASPQILRKTNGNHSVTSSQSGADPSSKTSKAKAPVEGEKVVIRRLPPGLTEEEFSAILGDTWKSGNGKVGWYRYEKGKISTDPAKPSKPSRAYLHVLRKDDLVPLSDAVRTATWEDAKESFTSPSLVGPPVVEFSIYKKIPSGKRRTDGRQGTIDQDPEFMAFLESLANPPPKEGGDEQNAADEEADKPGKVKSTPLIESLREKKASKVKEAAAAKSAKHARHDSQGKAKAEESKKGGGKERASDKPKETVKILTKKAATDAAVEAAKTAATQIQNSKGETQRDEAASKSRRAGIAAAARILQRDLGLSPGNAHRKARLDAAKAESEAKAAAAAAEKAPASASTSAPAPASPTTASPTTPVAPKAQGQAPAANSAATSSSSGRRGRRGRGGGGDDAGAKGKTDKPADTTSSAPEKTPVILLKKKDDTGASKPSPTPNPSPVTKQPPIGPKAATPTPASSSSQKPATQQQPRKSSPGTSTTPGATRAFIKHANPSQGVTEVLLRTAMSAFGDVKTVEIDRRKGFAYVDFSDAAALQKAIAASPVPVGEGGANVVVLERRDKEAAVTGGGGAGGGGRRGGKDKAAAATPAAAAAAGASSGARAPGAPAVLTDGKAAEGGRGDTSAPATPASAATSGGTEKDKAAGAAASGEKRGGRRRGGRGRGGGDRKDSPSASAPSGGGGGKDAGGGGGGKKGQASASGAA